ncbi:MAG: hypothetical protein IJS15_04135 [Victivallales bacterium]|nr:hypothetical protein [Victivallales bacterium]
MHGSEILRARLVRWLFARGAVFSLGVSVFVYAVLELARLLLQTPGKDQTPLFSPALLVASLIVFLVSTVTTAVLSYRKLPSREVLTAWIDDRNSFGGILQAEGTPGSAVWIGGLGIPKTPRLKVDFRREAVLLALAVLFLAAILLCPRTIAVLDDEHKLDIDDEMASLEDRIQILEQASKIPEEKVSELKEMLENIRENGYAEESAKTYELLDILDERVNSEIGSLRNSLVAEGTSMEMLAQALEAISKLDGKFASTAGAELAKFISELAEQDPELAKMLSELAQADSELSESELARRTADKSLTKEQCEKLAELLRKNSDRIKEKLRQMAEEMKKNPGAKGASNSLCENEVPFDEKSLEEWLNSNCPATMSAVSTGSCAAGRQTPGQDGTPSRGRDDAPLEFSGKTEKFDARYNEIGIDGMAKADDDASVVSRTLSAPVNAQSDAEAAGAGALHGGKSDAESKMRSVFPQHRRAVKQYFGD